MLGKFHLEGISPAPRGVPQIEVSFDVDANGIMNVSAKDKTTGKEEKITIQNDKGRLSQDDIDRMVDEAKKYEEEDKKMKQRIEAKNSLENYCYTLKTSLEDEANKQKISSEELTTVTSKVEETLQWLESGSLESETEEIEAKKTELEQVAKPIMSKILGGASDGGQAGPAPKEAQQETEQSTPIEEID